MMPIALCIPFPLFALCDDMLAMIVCGTCWLSMHFYSLAYMSMHESCLLVCHPCSNTMKLWTFDPTLHLSLADTTFCLPFFLFVFFLVCLSSRLFACFLISFLGMFIMLIYFMPLSHALCVFFLPLLVCSFLVFAFACTHMKRGCLELGVSKKSEDASMWI